MHKTRFNTNPPQIKLTQETKDALLKLHYYDNLQKVWINKKEERESSEQIQKIFLNHIPMKERIRKEG